MSGVTIQDIALFVSDIHEVSYLVVAFLGITFFRSSEYRLLLIFLLAVGSLRLGSLFVAHFNFNSIPFYHMIGGVELIIVFILYGKEFSIKYLKWILVILVLLYCLNSLLNTSIWAMNGIALGSIQLIIFGMGISYLSVLFNEKQPKRIEELPFFWINAGFMSYAAGSFLSFVMNGILVDSMSDAVFDSTWLIESCFGIIRLILISIGLYNANRKWKQN